MSLISSDLSLRFKYIQSMPTRNFDRLASIFWRCYVFYFLKLHICHQELKKWDHGEILHLDKREISNGDCLSFYRNVSESITDFWMMELSRGNELYNRVNVMEEEDIESVTIIECGFIPLASSLKIREFIDSLDSYELANCLFQAVRTGQLYVFREINLSDHRLTTEHLGNAFVKACKNNAFEIVEIFMSHSRFDELTVCQNVSEPDFRYLGTGLGIACKKGCLETVQILIQHPIFCEIGSELSLICHRIIACNRGHSEIVQVLNNHLMSIDGLIIPMKI